MPTATASRLDSTYRVIVTGSRSWKCNALAMRVVASLSGKHQGLIIVHGAAPGVDSAFAEAARRLKVATESHPARWEDVSRPGAVVRRRADGSAYDAAAGPNRNQEMVDAGADLCLAFHPTLDPKSGTADCVRRAIRAGIPTWWTNAEGATPVRQLLPAAVAA